MRKLIRFSAMLCALACLSSASLAQTPPSIAFSWTNNNSGIPTCSGTVTSTCLVGHTLTDTTVSGSPVVLSSSISPTATTYTTPLPSFTTTTRTYSLVVNYKDASGAAQATSAATASVSVPFVVNAPTGFTTKLQ
jgi:ABC-type transport system involved in multi-copper enzyme maturation permease subunit